MTRKLLFLGTGASAGTPVIGCKCSVCRSEEKFNKRLRPSVLLTVDDTQILIDGGPDFREQALMHNINHLNGVIITHTHYDHIGGLDDLRIFYFIEHKPIPCLLSEMSFEELKKRYYYIFMPNQEGTSCSAKFDCKVLDQERGCVKFLDQEIEYMSYAQGGMQVTGFRFNNLAYIPDIKHFPDTIYEDLKGVEILVMSALRHSESKLHFTVDDSIEFSQKVGASMTYLTHIAHDLDHKELKSYLPKGILPAYDRMEIHF